MKSFSLNRRNLSAARSAESWRPPCLVNPRSGLEKCIGAVRRFFDLQAGSIWRDLSQLLPSVSGDLLDAGCGGQPYRALLAGAVRYRGIDISESDVKFGYRAPDTLYYQGETWPVEGASADVVLCTETLEHVLRPGRFLSEASRVLRPGGRIILTVPFSARWHFIPHDYWRYTPSSLEHLLAETTFKEVQVYGRGNAVTVACLKAMTLVLSSLQMRSIDFGSLLRLLLAVAALPLFVLIAAIANGSLRLEAGDDCLGYTVIAEKPGEAPHG